MSHNDKKHPLILPYEMTGKTTSDIMILFLHGYPDSNRLWDNFAPEYENNYLVLKISYPNFDVNAENIEPWGRTIPQVIQGIKETINHIENQNGKKYKLFVVSHDWGAFFTYLFDKEFPNQIKNAVVLDIAYKMNSGIVNVILSLLYQITLATAFLMPRAIGDIITTCCLKIMMSSNGFKPYLKAEYNSSMNYFYYYMFRNGFYQMLFLIIFYYLSNTRTIFFIGLILFIIYKGVTLKSSNPFKGYKPSFPMAFIYGTDKPIMFHTDGIINELKLREGCEVHGFNVGHWVMIKNEAKINEIISRRLKTLK